MIVNNDTWNYTKISKCSNELLILKLFSAPAFPRRTATLFRPRRRFDTANSAAVRSRVLRRNGAREIEGFARGGDDESRTSKSRLY